MLTNTKRLQLNNIQVFRTLVEVTKDIPGAFVENHKFCTSVHYRNVEEKVRKSLVLHIVDVLRERCR